MRGSLEILEEVIYARCHDLEKVASDLCHGDVEKIVKICQAMKVAGMTESASWWSEILTKKKADQDKLQFENFLEVMRQVANNALPESDKVAAFTQLAVTSTSVVGKGRLAEARDAVKLHLEKVYSPKFWNYDNVLDRVIALHALFQTFQKARRIAHLLLACSF